LYNAQAESFFPFLLRDVVLDSGKAKEREKGNLLTLTPLTLENDVVFL
jgi:hypothetical protein